MTTMICCQPKFSTQEDLKWLYLDRQSTNVRTHLFQMSSKHQPKLLEVCFSNHDDVNHLSWLQYHSYASDYDDDHDDANSYDYAHVS